MNIILIVPNVVRRYIASFPEVTNNAYDYFNYDHRVVEERVLRGDAPSNYKGPADFSDNDYDVLVAFAQQNIDKGMARYSLNVACEDALHKAIRSFGNGQFDGKVNASRYNVLLGALLEKVGSKVDIPRQAKKDKVPQDGAEVKNETLRQLGLKKTDVPHMDHLINRVKKGLPHLVRDDKGKVKLKRTKK